MGSTIRIITASDARTWNEAVLRAPMVDLLQSWEWGEFKRRSGGWKPTRLLAVRGDEPLAGVQILGRRVMGAPSLYAPRGPWWSDQEGLRPLVRWLRGHLRLRAPFLRTDPLVSGEDAAPLLAMGFRPAPRQVQPKATITVDLTPSPDDLMARFDRQVRYNARLAERKGVRVVRGGRSEVEAFWKLLEQTATRKGFAERDLSYFTALADVYGEEAPVFLAYHEDQLIYGALIVRFGPVAYYLYGASGGDRSVKPSEFVQYQAMLWAKERGATKYDMWGIPAHPTEDNPLYGVYRFKSGFGGTVQQYVGALDLPLIPLAGSTPARLEALALKSLALARGEGFKLVDHLA